MSEKLIEPWVSEEGRENFYRQFAQADEKYTAEIEPVFGGDRCPVKKILWARKIRGFHWSEAKRFMR